MTSPDMPKDSEPTKQIACEICKKEVPLSEAYTSEAKDYVIHFCGMKCFAEWRDQADLKYPHDTDESQ